MAGREAFQFLVAGQPASAAQCAAVLSEPACTAETNAGKLQAA